MFLTDSEQKVLSKLLDLAGEHFGERGCNDFDVPNTPEWINAINSVADEGGQIIDPTGDTICTMDWLVLLYLRNKLGV